MSAFDAVTQHWGDLKYMDAPRAAYLRELIRKHRAENLLELGFAHGKSSAYLAAILEDEGRGHLTTIDVEGARRRTPAIAAVLEAVGLGHRVTPLFAERSFTWELAKMLERSPRPQFDFCYLDGGHTWDVTGFGFVLVDMLLKPGGLIVFDDLDWTIDTSPSAKKRQGKGYQKFSADERAAKGVRMVWEIIVPRFGYTDVFEKREFHWGIAQKPELNETRYALRSECLRR
jgi:predicted O-methyltransferase YrrM